jgi:hypothetical protein
VSEPFVASLRTSQHAPVPVGTPGVGALTIRVELPERWDVALLSASSTTSVGAVKLAALHELVPEADPFEYVIKLRGFEIYEESISLEDAGARDGSIFVLLHRRKRPVR